MAKINIPHTKCETGQTESFLTGMSIFSYTQLENLAQVYCVNLYIIYVIYICVWDRGEGHTECKSLLAISYIKAQGTQYSEENARKYDRNYDTRLYCSSTSRGSAAHDKCCQYESTMGARCSWSEFLTASAPLMLAVWNRRYVKKKKLMLAVYGKPSSPKLCVFAVSLENKHRVAR